MRRVTDDTTVVMHTQIGMVIFTVGDEGEGVHECHGLVVIVEMKGFADGLFIFDQIPVFQGEHIAGNCLLWQQVFGAFQGFAMAL